MAVNIDFRVKNGLAVTTTATIEGTTQSTSTSSGVLRVSGGAGIGKNLYVGGLIRTSDITDSTGTTTGALTVAGGVGVGGNLYVGNDLRIAGTLYGTVIGSVSTATNIFNGTVGQIPYQNNISLTSFFGPGIAGQILVSAGSTSTGPVFTNTSSIYVGYSVNANTSTNILGGSTGSIPIQSRSGTTAFIPLGTAGYILTAGSNTATWVSTSTISVAFSTSATNIAKGSAGQIPFQTATGITSFIAAGTAGNILVSYGTSSPVFQNTLTLAGNVESNSVSSGTLQVVGGAGISGNLYVGNTVSVLSTLSSTSSISQNALYVAGGVGIGSSLYVTGPSVFSNSVTFSGSTTNVLSTNTVYTDNIIELHYPNTSGNTWGVNDGKDIGLRFHYYDTQDRNAFLGRNNSDGYLEWLINSSSDGVSNITGTGGKFRLGTISLTDTTEATNYSTGTLVVAGGVGIGGNLYVNGTIFGNVSVSGTITTATNWYGGVPGSLIYQIDRGVTGFVTTATAGYILTSGGMDSPVYVSPTALSVGQSTTATNIAGGGVAQLNYQSASGITAFVGTGTAGQILVSAGTTSTGPVFTSTGTIFVGYATSATVISVIADTSSSLPQYVTFVGNNSGYNSIKTFSTALSFIPSTGYFGIGVATATVKLDVAGAVKITGITSITNPTSASSTTTGALTVAGGIGVGLDLYVGGNTNITGNSTISGNETITGNLAVNGGDITSNKTTVNLINSTTTTINFGGNATSITIGAVTGFTTFRNVTSVTNTASASSNITGALTVAGGVGIAKDLYVGGTIYATVAGTITGTASSATNIAGGTQGQIPIQSSTGTTVFIPRGNTGNLLQYNTSTNTATWVSTSSLLVGASLNSLLATNIASGSIGQIPFQSAVNKTAFAGPGTAGTVLVSAGASATGPVFQNTLTLAGVINSISTDSGTLQIAGGVGIGLDVYVGGIIYGTFNGNLTGAVTTATNIAGGTAGQIHYQSDVGLTSFAGPGTYGQVLMSTGAGIIGPIFTNTSGLSVATAVTSTNIAGGSNGSILYQTSVGKTGFIGIGTNGYVLTSNGTTATWQSISNSAVNFSNTATNILGGAAGQLHIQSGSGKTSFVVTGNTGNLLQYDAANNTATWVSTITLWVGYSVTATNIAGGTAGQIHYQTGTGLTSFFGPGTAGDVLVSYGTSGPLFQNTLTLTSIINAASTNTGALTVKGGVGIGGNLYVGGTIVGTFLGTINGTANTATNIEKGSAGQIPIQYGNGLTTFIAPGSNGSLLQYNTVTSTATWVSTTTMYVGNSINAVNATNITGGAPGSIPIQAATGATSFIPIGTSGFVLTAAGTSATWQALGGLTAGSATTATNIANGTAGQLVYQVSPGSSGFAGPGTAGQLLVSAGSTSTGPVFTNTSSIYVGYSVNATTSSHIGGGLSGQLHYQSSPGVTSFVSTGTVGNVLVTYGTSSPVFQNTLTLSGTTASTSPTTGALTVAGGVGISGNLWVGGSIYGIASINGSITTATNLAIGTAGQVPYNTSPGVTSWFGPGVAGNVLVSNGTSAPTYNSTLVLSGDLGVNGGNFTTNNTTFNLINTTATTVNFAGAATTITLGVSGGTTTVKGNLVVAGNWTVQGTTTIVDSTVTNIADPIIILGGGANNTAATVDDNKDRGVAFRWMTGGAAKLGFFGYSDSSGFLTFIPDATISGEVASGTKGAIDASIAGGTANSIFYSSSPNVTTWLAAGTSGYILQTNGTGSAPTWVNPSALSASNANNITGGSAGQMLIQSGSGATTFISGGNTGNILQYNSSTNTATWISTTTMYVGNSINAITATNLAAGTTGSIHYQSGPGVTAFLAASTSGYILSTQGPNTAPIWINAGSAIVPSNLNVTANTAAFEYIVGVAGSGSSQAATIAQNTNNQFGFNASTGVVGIGTTGPLNKLHIYDPGSAYQIRLEGHNSSGIDIRTTSQPNGAQLAFDGSGGFQIKQSGAGLPVYINMNGTVRFLVSSTGAISFNGTNNVGTSGQYLQSAGWNASPTWVDASSIAAGSAPLTNTYVGFGSASNLLTGSSSLTWDGAKLSISSGALGTGAGTQIVSQRFTVTDANTDNLEISNIRGTAGAGWDSAGWRIQSKIDATWMGYIQFNGTPSGFNSGGISFGSGTTTSSANSISERMRIDSSGNVGIGTTSPTDILNVYRAGTGNTGITVSSNSGSSISLLSNRGSGATNPLTQAGDASINFSAGSIDTGSLVIGQWSNYSRGIRIDSSGKVGIGINPSYTLDVAGSIYATQGLADQSGTNTPLRLVNPGGASNWAGVSSQTGAIKIKLPQVAPGYTMMRMTIKVYTYDSLSFTIECGGYTYAGPTWYNTFANMTTQNRSALTVRFGHDGTTFCIYVGELNTAWSYPNVFVTDFQAGYSNNAASTWNTGWVISYEASAFGTVTAAPVADPGYFKSLGVGTLASGTTGEIRATNEITAYYSSDARLKENVTPIEDPIKMLEQIRGVYFDWTDEHIERRGGEDGYFVRKHDIGVIAQEVEAILPEIVATREDGFKAVKYEKIVPLLIETIKAQQKQIDQIMATLKNLINK